MSFSNELGQNDKNEEGCTNNTKIKITYEEGMAKFFTLRAFRRAHWSLAYNVQCRSDKILPEMP